ncbi:methyl-accepting chemotaxis protein [Candidatus Magnetomorum sp. HK-1]|nr:methyl-accepting chemotaxis protein [Candidatus Magnetomorum sp. HK-1]
MKISSKMMIMFAIALLISEILIAWIGVYSIQSKAEQEIEDFAKNERYQIKQKLKNYVHIAYETMQSNYENSQNIEYQKRMYGLRLESIIDAAHSIVNSKITLVKKKILTEKEAKNDAIKEIQAIRYDNGSGYIWINDMGRPFPKMVMHPTVPALNGKVLDNPKYNCALGVKRNLFAAFVDVCEKDNKGFVDYLWPKPVGNGLTKEQPKLSYVRRIKEWDWVIGTGIYLDDAIADAIEKTKQDIEKMRYDDGVGYFWINDNGKPFPKMVMHPTVPALNGKVLDNPKYNCASGIKKNLFQAAVEVSEKNGDGFVDYLWPKPVKGGLTKEQPKLSCVKYFAPWGWVIGTGVYIDDITVAIQNKQLAVDQQIKQLTITIMWVSLVIALTILLFVAFLVKRIISNPIIRVVDFAKRVSDGNLSQTIQIKRKDEIGQMTNALNNMVGKFKAVGNEIEDIVTNIDSGKLDKRGDISKFKGSYNDLIQGCNTLADVLIGYINSINIPAIIIDNEFNLLFISKPGANLLNKKQEELIGCKCYDLFNTSDCKTLNCACEQAIKKDQICTREASCHLMTNNDMEISYTGIPVKNREGVTVGAFEIIIDQTEIKNAMKISHKISDYQSNEAQNLSSMLQKIADGDMTQRYCPLTGDDDTENVFNNFKNIGDDLNSTIAKIEKVNSFQENEVKNLSKILLKMSEGDLMTTYTVSSSDQDTKNVAENFTQIAKALNETIKKLADIISQVKENAEILSTSSGKLSSVSVQLADGSEKMSSQANRAADTTGQMSKNIDFIASASNMMRTNSSNVSDEAELMAKNMSSIAAAIEEMTNSMREVSISSKQGSQIAIQAKDMSGNATNAMNKLSNTAKDIGKVTSVIKRIAEQTNLLALNATIEAASAGDAGRGFAVVANEIKELANQSAHAAEDITKKIKGVQDDTIESVEIIDQITQVITKIELSVRSIAGAVDEQSLTTNEMAENIAHSSKGIENIATSISEVAEAVDEMSANSSEAAANVKEVSSNIHDVSRDTEDVNKISNELKNSAVEQSKISDKLMKNVNIFKIK